MISRLKVEPVERDFRELGLGHPYKATVSHRLETVKVFFDRFPGVLPIRCSIPATDNAGTAG